MFWRGLFLCPFQVSVCTDFVPKTCFGTLGLLGSILGAILVWLLHSFSDAEFRSFVEGRFCVHFTYAFIEILLPKPVLAAWTLLGGLRWGPLAALAHEIRIIAAVP